MTVTLARLSKGKDMGTPVLAGGILLASTVMLVRVLLVAATLNRDLLVPLAVPFGAAALVFLGAAGFLLLRPRPIGPGAALTLTNPLELGVSLKLAGFIAATMLLAKLIIGQFGDAGLYLLAATSGLADVDALTLSLARMSETSLAIHTAAIGIAIAVTTNTISKSTMTAILGTPRLGLIVGGVSLGAIAAGALAHALF